MCENCGHVYVDHPFERKDPKPVYIGRDAPGPDGWYHTSTGGGCTALQLDVTANEKGFWLLTVLDDACAPEDHEACSLGRYTEDGDPAFSETLAFPDVASAKRAVAGEVAP
jgi:hypothetical protein